MSDEPAVASPEVEAGADAMPPAAPPVAPAEAPKETALDRARRLLDAAMRKPVVRPAAPMAPGSTPKVDKYFGEKLPPVCSRLGCYLTDDGKRYYCINHACQKHLKRETKHSRRGNPLKTPLLYFRCPRCNSRNIDMHPLSNRYACRACLHSWVR